MLQVALAHNWMELVNRLIDLIQCIVQAVPAGEESRAVAELLQLSAVTPKRARDIVAKDELGREGIQGLYKMERTKARELLGVTEIGEKQCDHILKVAGDWPRLELVDAYFKGEFARARTPILPDA